MSKQGFCLLYIFRIRELLDASNIKLHACKYTDCTVRIACHSKPKNIKTLLNIVHIIA
jgi:hypothetical protein